MPHLGQVVCIRIVQVLGAYMFITRKAGGLECKHLSTVILLYQ